MKKELNTATIPAARVNEEHLFRSMANSLNKYTNTLYVNSVHGRTGWVSFNSSLTGKQETKEMEYNI